MRRLTVNKKGEESQVKVRLEDLGHQHGQSHNDHITHDGVEVAREVMSKSRQDTAQRHKEKRDVQCMNPCTPHMTRDDTADVCMDRSETSRDTDLHLRPGWVTQRAKSEAHGDKDPQTHNAEHPNQHGHTFPIAHHEFTVRASVR